MMQVILSLDSKLTSLIASTIPHNRFFDYLFSFLSIEGNWIIIWLSILFLLFAFEEKRDKKFIIYFLISLLITIFVVNIVLKNVFQRQRPYLTHQIEAIQCPRDYSFPSTHAAGAFAGATIIAAFDKKRRYIYYGIALLISLSRIYLYCHYFLDVSIGGYIGYIISNLILSKTSYRHKL